MNLSIASILKQPPDKFLYAALLCSTFAVSFNVTLPLMASTYIVGDLGGSNSIASYVASFFALGSALGVPLGRGLVDRIGTLRFFIISMFLFVFFSFICTIAPNYPIFNIARFLQGFFSGPFYALMSLFTSTLVPSKKLIVFNAINLSILTVTPSLGASWGGWIAYEGNWRWIFYIDFPLTLFLIFYLINRLKGFSSNQKEGLNSSFDGIGYLSFFIAVFCLGIAVITGQQLDWFRSPLITVFTILGTLSLAYFVIWELNHPNPIINLRLLKNIYFSFSIFNLAILFSAYYGMIVLLPLWLHLWVNYTFNWIALLIGTMAIAGLFPMVFTHKAINKIDNRVFLAFSIVFLAISSFHTATFNVDINFGRIAFSRVLAGIGLALFLAPIFRLSFGNFPEEKRVQVLTLFQIVRFIASGFGAALYTTMWQRREAFYRDRMGGQLTALSQETQDFFSNAKQFNLHGDMANAQLDYYLQRESSSLALDDCFYLMGIIFIATLLTFGFTLFISRSGFTLSQQEKKV